MNYHSLQAQMKWKPSQALENALNLNIALADLMPARSPQVAIVTALLVALYTLALFI